MQGVVVGIGARRVLAVIGIVGIGPAPIVVARCRARRNVLIDRNDQVKPTQVMVADAHRSMLADLLLDFETGLLRIGVLNGPVHRRETDQRHQRHHAA